MRVFVVAIVHIIRIVQRSQPITKNLTQITMHYSITWVFSLLLSILFGTNFLLSSLEVFDEINRKAFSKNISREVLKTICKNEKIDK
jgi:hypothetical protein